MTAQNDDAVPNHVEPAAESTDPLGPISLPKRSKIGARAMALVGTVGLSAVGAAVLNTEPGWPITSISHH